MEHSTFSYERSRSDQSEKSHYGPLMKAGGGERAAVGMGLGRGTIGG